jgi:hypothetical protein
VDFPSLGNSNNNGACAGGYDRGDGPVFDLSESSRFEIDVQAVTGGMSLGITLVDTNEDIGLSFIESVTPGQNFIAFIDMFSPIILGSIDFSSIDNIGFSIINQEGQEGSVTLAKFSTDGPIKGGASVPVDDDIFPEEVSGTYFNASRDGEGCQLTRERDDATFILTCYFYDKGKQFWLIGAGVFSNGQIIFAEMTITSGADYGNAFDPADVVRTTWGSIILTWSDCNNVSLDLNPIIAGYEDLVLGMTRILPTICGAGGVQLDILEWMGAYFHPDRDGEGFHFGVEEGGVIVMTWYTYLKGEQVWMIGTGIRDGFRVVFDNMIITSGASFGSEFDPTDVVRTTFGKIIVDFTDCNRFTATVESELPEFSNLVLDVTKVVPGVCL